MKKKALAAAGIFIILLMGIFALNTYGSNEIIRVGLKASENTTQVQIGGQTVMTGYSSVNRFTEVEYLDLSGGATVSKSYSYYIAVGGGFASYDEAKAYAAGLTGYNAIPAYKGSTWNVYIGPYESNERAIQAHNNYKSDSVVCAPTANTVYLNGSGERMIYDCTSGNFAFAGDTLTNINGRTYRGYIELYPTSAGFSVVNVIALEDYLKGVVPSEMPSDWNIEALKAQACAARTYTVHMLAASDKSGGYDICDTTHCQAYNGAGGETASTNEAVSSTSGVIITYGGSPIDAVYCSSAGGVTDDGAAVWGTDTPYLKSVKEIDGAEVYEWSRTYSYDQLKSLLAANGAQIGKLVYMDVTRSANGRVQKMTFYGESSSFSVEGEKVRTFFSSTEGGSLQSRVFDISFDHSVSEGFNLVMNGKGWGHGLGLSQYGANSMGQAGYTYDQIIKHYYTGVEISGS